MKRALLKLKIRLMSTRALILMNNRPEWEYYISGRELARRYPDDTEFEIVTDAIYAELEAEEAAKIDISDIFR